jgi:ABC-type polysaccharide/polyol phosphate transport system ATPase subunit
VTPVVIELDQVSKRYRAARSRTFAELVGSRVRQFIRPRDESVYSHTLGKRDPNIWAVRDLDFQVHRGAGLGIIGPNGAGKTTLLKLISRVTWPTSGRVRVAGRVVSLIELGAGFHPELTGRENIYLGGGLFGLSRRDIAANIDRIVEFAGVERMIDAPMKRYSSGLYARLGFSVAIHSHPDIVLVDEVLAVGDAAFRRRAMDSLQKMIEAGKTVLFISHDMWNVRRLCDHILWMDQGRIRAYGPAAEMAERYLREVNLEALANERTAVQSHRRGTGEIRFTSIRLLDGRGAETKTIVTGDSMAVAADYRATEAVPRPLFHMSIVDVDTGFVVTTASSSPARMPVVDGTGSIRCVFPSLPLRPRHYILRLAIYDALKSVEYDHVTAGPRFIVTPDVAAGVETDDEDGFVTLPCTFEYDGTTTKATAEDAEVKKLLGSSTASASSAVKLKLRE